MDIMQGADDGVLVATVIPALDEERFLAKRPTARSGSGKRSK